MKTTTVLGKEVPEWLHTEALRAAKQLLLECYNSSGVWGDGTDPVVRIEQLLTTHFSDEWGIVALAQKIVREAVGEHPTMKSLAAASQTYCEKRGNADYYSNYRHPDDPRPWLDGVAGYAQRNRAIHDWIHQHRWTGVQRGETWFLTADLVNHADKTHYLSPHQAEQLIEHNKFVLQLAKDIPRPVWLPNEWRFVGEPTNHSTYDNDDNLF